MQNSATNNLFLGTCMCVHYTGNAGPSISDLYVGKYLIYGGFIFHIGCLAEKKKTCDLHDFLCILHENE